MKPPRSSAESPLFAERGCGPFALVSLVAPGAIATAAAPGIEMPYEIKGQPGGLERHIVAVARQSAPDLA